MGFGLEAIRKAKVMILDISEGKAVQEAADGQGLGIRTFFEIISSVRDLGQAYARAQEVRADLLVDEIIPIADTAIDPQKAKNQIDARRWVASKLNTKKYGDRIDLNVQQSISITDALSEARLRVLRPVCDQPTVIDAQVIDNTLGCADSAADGPSIVAPPIPDIFS